MSIDAFTARVAGLWGRRLNVPPEAFARDALVRVAVPAGEEDDRRAGPLFFFKPPPLVRANRVLVYRTEAAHPVAYPATHPAGSCTLVLFPETLAATLADRVMALGEAAAAMQEGDMLRLLAPLGGRLLWRDHVHYLRPEHRAPASSLKGTGTLSLNPNKPVVRVLSPEQPADADLLDRLNAALSPTEREMGEVSIAHYLAAGLFVGKTLCAAASFIDQSAADTAEGENVLDVGVITHPDHRGRGYGAAVVRGLCAVADEARLIQYSAAETNTASLATARTAGFTPMLIEEGYAITP
jgi:GNAT superfamily N-acetyltransferase